MKSLFIAADHAGFALKENIKNLLKEEISFVDLGCESTESVHYPTYSQKLCHVLLNEKDEKALLEPCGILICGSGIGVYIAANRFKKIRAALVHNEELARLSRSHNGANVLCLAARFLKDDEAVNIIRTWVHTSFEGGRHAERVQMMDT